ncbi:MAG: SRPBCC family protein [Actinomycetota bacterium]
MNLIGRGWPVLIELTVTLPGPPDVVWELLTDWEHQGDWMLEASDFVVVSAARTGIGVEAAATVKIGGIKTRDRIRVTGWEPPKRLAIEHLGWVSGRAELHLTPGLDAPATHLYWKEELRPPLGLLGALGLSAFKPLMMRVFQRDLRVLQGLVRARTAAV